MSTAASSPPPSLRHPITKYLHHLRMTPLSRQFMSFMTRLLRFRVPRFGRRRPQLFDMPRDIYEDVYGLPGDTVSDVPKVLSEISHLMDSSGVRWCVVGDILLAHYCVPKITGDIEICVPSAKLPLAQEAFNSVPEFCSRFRTGRSSYNRHLAPYPRFRVVGMNQCFFLVPASHYGLHSKAFDDIMHLPSLGFPLLPLPHYVQGLASIAVAHGTTDNNFLSQLEFLIDGMDIDEEWCCNNLNGPGKAFVSRKSTRRAKKARMGSHPKYEGNLTTYIHDWSDRHDIIGVVGRVMEYQKTVPRFASPSSGGASVSALPASSSNAVPIQVMSDLHLEAYFRRPAVDSGPGYEVFDCTPSSPVLALLGDIGLAVDDGLFVFLQRQLFKYERIFFVMGNHEYYRTNYDAAKARVISFADQMHKLRYSDNSQGEFIFLDRTRYDLTDYVTILGCTLWSHIPPTASKTVERRLNDFKKIHGWSIESHNSTHLADAEWLDHQCAKIKTEEPQRRIVIFTHHAPATQGTSPPEHMNSPINSGFATDMTVRSCWDYPVSLWAFGHTHFNCDFIQGNVRVVSNQRGYEGSEASRTGFSQDMTLYV